MLVITQLAAALAIAGAPASAPPPVKVYRGRLHQIEASIPRLDGAISVDGVLDEPEWQQAAVTSTGRAAHLPWKEELDGSA